MFGSNQINARLLRDYTSQDGQTLAALITERDVLLVFLRHFGCAFCREAVSDLVERRGAIESQGTRLAFVHLGSEEKAQWFFKPYGLLEVPRFSDPLGRLYEEFGLLRWNWRQYLNIESVFRLLSASLKGHRTGLPTEDIERMPGVFQIRSGEIRKAFRHKLVSDRPDYLALATAN
jgi:peroxiredoxin